MPDAIMNATVGQIAGGTIGVLFIISLFIEITPIKWNPLSFLMKWIGERVNAELSKNVRHIEKQLDCVKRTVDELRLENMEQNAIAYRVRILRFGDEILHGVKHSKESFDQVLEDIDGYEKYCTDHPEFKNNKTVLTTSKIKEVYTECINKNSFL